MVTSADRRLDPERREDVESDYRWMWPIWGVVAVFGLLAIARSIQVGIPFRDPHGDIGTGRVAISLGLFVVLSLGESAWRAHRTGLGAARLLTAWRARWTGKRLLIAMGALAAYHLTYFCYHSLKSWNDLRPTHDDLLLTWDRWLFFGHSPAVLLHDLLGEHVAAWVLAYWYETFGTLVLIAIVLPLVSVSRIRDGWVAMTAGVWIWILGTTTYYLIPTLGPFDGAPQEFAGLPHMMIQDTQARYIAQREHLLAHPGAHDAFAQVAAFASLHVGVSTVIWLMARWYGQKWLARILAVFLAGTVVATVYLGWHFFVDDIVGFAIGWLSVRLGVKMVYPHGRTAQPGHSVT